MITIMRGLPGSGKSTWIKNNLPANVEICSADHFHMVDGVYKYDPKNAGYAHAACLNKYLNMLAPTSHAQHPDIVVDNTNISAYELAPYVAAANAYGREYEIVYLNCLLEQAVARNVHEVPAGTLLYMARKLITEDLPPHWKMRLVF